MNNQDAGWLFLFGMVLGGLFIFLIMNFLSIPSLKIESQESFIWGNATYKCKKTNELKEGLREQSE